MPSYSHEKRDVLPHLAQMHIAKCWPPLLYTTGILKGLFYLLPGPRTGEILGDATLKLLGITDSMDHFVGRGGK